MALASRLFSRFMMKISARCLQALERIKCTSTWTRHALGLGAMSANMADLLFTSVMTSIGAVRLRHAAMIMRFLRTRATSFAQSWKSGVSADTSCF
jgi:hypothetical protein